MNILSPSELINCQDLVSCFQNLYNLFFSILVALAFLYFIWGAVEYLLSGASFTSKETGKKKMINSIVAVIVTLLLPVIINWINPDIFKGQKLFIPVIKATLPGISPGKLPGAGTPADYTKLPRIGKEHCNNYPTSGYCTVEYIKKQGADESLAKKLALICKFESGGSARLESEVDRCSNIKGHPTLGDKPAFSIGLFQHNIFYACYNDNDNFYIGYENDDFYIGYDDDNNFPQECCEFQKSIPKPSLKIIDSRKFIYECTIPTDTLLLYKKCVEKLKDPAINTKLAILRANGGNNLDIWTTWKIGIKDCF